MAEDVEIDVVQLVVFHEDPLQFIEGQERVVWQMHQSIAVQKSNQIHWIKSVNKMNKHGRHPWAGQGDMSCPAV